MVTLGLALPVIGIILGVIALIVLVGIPILWLINSISNAWIPKKP